MNARFTSVTVAVVALLGAPGAALAQAWPDVNAGLVPVQHSALAWGDFDQDDDLDLLVMGWAAKSAGAKTYTVLYRNDGGGVFTPAETTLVPLQAGAAAWGDFDRDGDLDLAISGQTDVVGFTRRTILYRNDGGSFVDIDAGLPGVNNGALAWGDYDNDGDLDLALTGWTGAARLTRIYRNGGGAFSDSGVAITGVNYGQIAWADYDNDGDLDLALCGWIGGASYVTRIYRNQGGTFTDIAAGLPGVGHAALAWGDYDNDGDFDLLVSGYEGVMGFGVRTVRSRIFANTAGAFSDAVAGLGGTDGRGNVEFCSNAWGDFDNDGFLDIALAGWTETPGMSTRVSRILRSDSGAGTFTNISAGLGAMKFAAVAWADYDNDGDLDIANSGQVGGADGERTRIHRNDVPSAPNTPPTAPGDLAASVSGGALTFSWSAASDAETPAAGLTYNLRVGTAPGADNVLSGMANPTTGYRRLPAIGNAQQRLSWTLHGVSGPLYWSVQAIDGAFAGGAWAPEAHVP